MRIRVAGSMNDEAVRGEADGAAAGAGCGFGLVRRKDMRICNLKSQISNLRFQIYPFGSFTLSSSRSITRSTVTPSASAR